MIKSDYSFSELKFSSQLVRDLIEESPKVEPFLNTFFDLDHVYKQIEAKSFSAERRSTLVQALFRQNDQINLSGQTKANIESLNEETTYTITTGHQLNLLTGPLYSIYKVAQVLSITQQLNKQHSGNQFIPVFWMATEDHDFEEINHIHLFGQKFEWNKADQENVIAGRINTVGINGFIDQIDEKFADPDAKEIVRKFLEAYQSTKSLAAATRFLMNMLFGDKGLVIIDGDDLELKALFKPIFKKEVQESLTYTKVNEVNKELDLAGYHQQVYVRECNLFFIDESGVRHRILLEDDSFKFANREFSKEQLLDAIESNPENFSPNALLRPVYQESILPNLAYIGGGGEIAYWLQLKSVFNALNLTYPLLKVRDSILILNSKQQQLLNENEIDLLDLKIGVDHLIKDMALEEANPAIDLTSPRKLIAEAESSIKEKANKINPGLTNMVEAEFSKFAKSLERIESKLIKAEKSKFEGLEKKLDKIKNQIYPNGGFQERYENFIPYMIKYPNFIEEIIELIPANDSTKIRVLTKD